jgi:glycosyltransferase involved in cell wall biosynthesis
MQTIASVLQREQIDVVYSPFAWPDGTAGLPAATAAHIPIVVSLRGVDALVVPSINYGSTLAKWYLHNLRITLSTADHVIGVSKCLAERGVELGARPSQTSILLKGVHADVFKPADKSYARRQLGLVDAPTILFAGNLIPVKDPMTLLQAFKHVCDQIPQARLILCGTGSLEGEMRTFVSTQTLEDRVRFAGHVSRDQMPLYFQACDVFVLPSLSEGSGNVLVEAAACARPSVGSNSSGIPDYIDEGITGLLFEPQNALDLANKLSSLLNSPALLQEMGLAARERVEKLHLYDHYIDQLIDVFRKVKHRQLPTEIRRSS